MLLKLIKVMKLKKLLFVLFTLFCVSIYGQPQFDCPCSDPGAPDYMDCLALFWYECEEGIPVSDNILVLCMVGVVYAGYLYVKKNKKELVA
jgi:hypothetical protein